MSYTTEYKFDERIEIIKDDGNNPIAVSVPFIGLKITFEDSRLLDDALEQASNQLKQKY